MFLSHKRHQHKFNLFTGLFFFSPVLGFMVFGKKYWLLHDDNFLLMMGFVLAFAFLGFVLLRRLFDTLLEKSENTPHHIHHTVLKEQFQKGTDELSDMVASLKHQCSQTSMMLDKKVASIAVLKEFSDTCYITFDPDEILYIALERSLTLTSSDLGSILMLQEPGRKSFVVAASIGGEDFVQKGDRIDFETSIAKYAVINKAPLVVEDIEKDTRFGRKNRSRYGTKSFICMPIKTSNNIAGVLTLSRKNSDTPFDHEDVEALESLLSNAAFTYENLNIFREIERKTFNLKFIEKVIGILSSSYKISELLHSILTEYKEVVSFDLAVVMAVDDFKPDYITIVGLHSREPVKISNGSHYNIQGSSLDNALKQDGILIAHYSEALSNELEKELFMNQRCSKCFLVPLKIKGMTKGLLAIAARDQKVLQGVDDVIQWMPKILALAIERNKLSAAVLQRNQELNTIRQIGTALASSTFDIKKVLNYTMDMIRVLMNVEAGSMYLVQGDELEFAAAFNIEAAFQKKLRLKLGQGIPGLVAARGEPIIANDAQTSPYFSPNVDSIMDFKTKSTLCVPIISQGKVIGVIEVLNKINGDFVVNDEELLQSIGASVSIAIENASLYQETISMAEQERGLRSMFQKYVPKEILDQIIHGSKNGKDLVEELKTLTLINVDIRNFSGLARKFGPQKTVYLLNHFFSTMGGIVFKHHGIVDKYLGDGFLAIFGAPVSSTKDADNALAAALEMQAAVSTLNDFLVKEFGTSVNIGISVHTGEAVVGSIGFDMKMDYTVIGDSVNDVFRLQELTKTIPNGILISANTSRAARSRLDLIEIEPSIYHDTSLKHTKIYELLGFKTDHEETMPDYLN